MTMYSLVMVLYLASACSPLSKLTYTITAMYLVSYTGLAASRDNGLAGGSLLNLEQGLNNSSLGFVMAMRNNSRVEVGH